MAHVYELATFMHNSAGNFFQNVFKYELSESGSGVSPFDYADSLIASWVTACQNVYMALFGNDVTLDFYAAKKINGGGGPASQHISTASGSSVNPSGSAGAAIDIQWQTASPLNRPGHTYIAAYQNEAVIGDVPQGAPAFPGGAFIAAILNPLTLAGALGSATFGIYTRKTDAIFTVNGGRVRPKVSMFNRRLRPQI
jgi:hypothetical protein